MFSLPGYRPLEVIARGSKRAVVRAERLGDHQAVVVKMLLDDYPSPREIGRLRHEYEMTRRAAAESVVQVYELCKERNGLAMILEDVGGDALSRFLARQRIELDTFFDLAIRLVSALGGIHERSIIHKDINPSNVIFNERTGALRIIDFGIASLLAREDQQVASPDMIEGTLAYMSPEQTGRMNRAVDWRTDFYSLGVSFYEMLTGQLPFAATDAMELVHCHIAREPPSPHRVDPSIPPMLSRLVLKLLAKTAEERYSSARGLIADLDECRQQWTARRAITEFPLGCRDSSERFQIPQKLYGRGAEVATLMQAFDRVRDGATELMLITGYAGIGKSALVNEIQKPIVEARGYFVSGKFDQLQRNQPFASLILALKELVRQLLTESDEQLAVWRERLTRAVAPNGQVVIDVLPEVELIIGPQPPVPELPPGPGQNRFNLVFRQFIRVFASRQHPLVIFLDDLQWADSASLELLYVLLSDPETRWLFVIGAYRDSEVDASHPLRLALDRLQASGASSSTVALGPLDLATVTQLVDDTVHCGAGRAHGLAELLIEKTNGNPFFLNEFLKNLFEEQYVSFDRQRDAWTWELARIRERRITDNVVELMAEKLRRLSAPTRAVVALAACIGNEFDLDMLAIVHGATPSATVAQLWEALQAGLIRPIGGAYRWALAAGPDAGNLLDGEEVRFRFLHDRVQQAAYASIAEERRPEMHLRIGRLLLDAARAASADETRFDVIDHLNRGRTLMASCDERAQLATFNLAAARKAKASTAFGPALAYATTGSELLGDDGWRSDHELCFHLYVEAAECAYLVGEYDRMEERCTTALAQARTVLEQAEVYETRIKACMARNQMREAVEIATQVLPLLGVRLPRRPTRWHVLPALAHAMWLIGPKTTTQLAALPHMTEPTKLAAMRILTTVAQPAYYAAPEMLPIILLRMVVISMRYGNTPLAPYAWMGYAHILNLVFGNVPKALDYGQFSRDLLARYDATEYRAKIEFMFHSFIHHWTAHWRDTLEPLVEAYRAGLDTGDLEYGATAVHLYCYHLFCVGRDLPFVEAEMARYNLAIARMKQVRSENNARLRHQVVLNLMGRAADPTRLVGDEFDEDAALAQLLEGQDHTGLCQFFMYKALLAYLFGHTPQAAELIERAERHIEGLQGLILQPMFYFYQALVLLDAAGVAGVPARRRRRYRAKAAAARKKLQYWARFAPMNLEHKIALIDAERARLDGGDLRAMELYDRAIAGARTHEYLFEEALAFERAAQFQLARGRTRIAQAYLLDARHAWLRWGALGKVGDLDARYSEWMSGGAATRPPHSTVTVRAKTSSITLSQSAHDAADTFDLSTVMKAAQAISGEIVLPRLLEQLMTIVIENAGAQWGFLLLESDGQLRIEAEGATDSDAVTVGQSIAIDQWSDGRSARLPVSMVKYVARTQEAVVLANATHDGRFTRDPYVVVHQPRSVVCAPLLDQGKLSGIVYLENNLTADAFTPARLEMLRVLSAQAAIAIDNARLYTNLQAALETQVKLTEAQARFVPREFLQSLNRNSIVDVALGDNVRKEMSVLFSDIRGFTSIVEALSPQEHISFINTYLSYMEPAIMHHGGFVDSYIGDAVMALFDAGADRAVQAAIAMSANLRRLNADRAAHGLAPVRMGVGINTGTLTLGTIGGLSRIKCSVIGDPVNLAARVESLTKVYDAGVLISHHTYERLTDPAHYIVRLVDRVTVVGKSVSVTLYEVLDAELPERRDAKLATLASYTEAVERYYRADFAGARRLFRECLAGYPDDVPAQGYLARCARYLDAGVPADWSGVEVLEHK